MRRRLWLAAMLLYAAIGIVDGAYHFMSPQYGAARSSLATLPVAFCAGLFWPIDIVARPLLLH